MRSPRPPALLVVVVALAASLVSCSDDHGAATGTRDHDTADVEFAAEMVPHHEQALRMVAMTRGRHLSPAFGRLTRQARRAQAPEIRTMQGWLDDWGAEPDHDRDMMHGGGDGTGTMGNANGMMGDSSGFGPGMMTGRDFRHLGRTPTRSFEDMWLRMMIRHHQGAIALARDEAAHGRYPAAVALARHIEESQRAEIQQMRRMLAD